MANRKTTTNEAPPPMKADEFLKIREALGLKQSELALKIGSSVNRISVYENGHEAVPASKAALMRLLADAKPKRRAPRAAA